MYKSIVSAAAAILIMAPHAAFGQTGSSLAIPYFEENPEMMAMIAMLITLSVAIIVILAMSSFLIDSVDDLRRQALIDRGILPAEEEEDVLTKLWRKLLNSLNDSVPVTQEQSIDMGHDYDGIRELDNNLPPWWKMLFYGTIVWSVGYIIYFHMSDAGVLQAEEFEQEMAEAKAAQQEYLEAQADMVDENSVVALDDAAGLGNGKRLYTVNCVACHGALGEGGVGPNLTDAYWLHGGGIKNVFKTIKYGVPAKGMIAWQTQMKPGQMQEVASYILTLQGTNPPNGKDPQGDIWADDSAGETITDTVSGTVDAAADSAVTEPVHN